MQREGASLGSISEPLNSEHGSTSNNAAMDQQILWENIHRDNGLQDYMMSAADTNTTFVNSGYHEQRGGLHRFSLGEASSSGPKNEAASHSAQWMEFGHFEERRNDKPELNPLFVQPSSGNNRAVRNVNLNAEYNEHLEDMNPVMGHHPGRFDVNAILPESSVRAGSSVDGRRTSCKRKAIDAGIGQSSSSGGFREFQRGESSSWVSTPTFYSQGNDLNISLGHGPRGFVSNAAPNLSAPTITDSSSRNFSLRVNPSEQQETVNPAVFSAGSVIRRPVAPPLNSPADQQMIDLRYGHFASQSQNASASHMPPVSRNMIPPFQWSGGPVPAGGSSSSAAPVIHRDDTRQRSNILEIPSFVPVPQLRNLGHSHISRNVSGATAGHVASSSSRTSVQPPPPPPPPSNPSWNPYQSNSSQNHRRLSEQFRRSLLSSLATTNQRAARSVVPPPPTEEQLLQSGGDNTSQVPNRAYSRAGTRQGQNATGISSSLRALASTSRGRSRLGASEIRNVLEHMRRGGNLRFEDVMLLNQSMLGVADMHDRYRDMRLDVDNMSYEELLSLEERIGDVCTGLKEETISDRLKQQTYKSCTRSPKEEEPCCICQEEYNEGDAMGMLECGHVFHSQCIKEWLKQKNLCPICKTTGLNTTEKPKRE